MDYQTSKEEFTQKEVVLDQTKEQAIDVDFNLPDYCPDIRQILKCRVLTKINSNNILSDRLEIDGVADISVLYLDDKSTNISVCEHSMPFNLYLPIPADTNQDAIVLTQTKSEYINCRAVSLRRLDIHGAFSVHVKILTKKTIEIVTDIEGEGLEQKKTVLTTNDIIGTGMDQFLVEESLETQDFDESTIIVRTDASTVLTNYKTEDNKVVIKGEITLKVFSAKGLEPQKFSSSDYSIPISQAIDVTGATENSKCEVKFDLIGYTVNKRKDSAEGNFLDVGFNIATVATVYEEHELSLIKDVYSLDCEIKPIISNIKLEKFSGILNENFQTKESIEFNNKNISKVLDIWNEVLTLSTKQEGDMLVFFGKLNLCILALDLEKNLFYTEHLLNFEYQKPIDNAFGRAYLDAEAKIMSLAFRIANEKNLEVRIDLKISAFLYFTIELESISEISIDNENQKEKDTAAIIIYYADAGEEIWNIAKTHNTTVEAIKTQNDLENDVLKNDSVILIPTT
ncbi:MAG: DUF3794 domain-containing protein [Oscillospiraceae bacterium]|jgi:hypothetical protein|nr:DUF3794 domain-containing protein [Oscillospiraceae bacterium]